MTKDKNDLTAMHQQADELLAKLRSIKELIAEIQTAWEKLPSEDDLKDFAKCIPDASSLEG